MKKYFIFIFVLFLCIIKTTVVNASSTIITPYEHSKQMMPFRAKSIPKEVSDVAKNYMSLCGLNSNDNDKDYTIDLGYAIISYEDIDVFKDMPVDLSVEYFTFNIGKINYLNLEVTHQITVSYNGVNAEFVRYISDCKNNYYSSSNSFMAPSDSYYEIYSAGKEFNEYLTMIDFSDSSILVWDKGIYYIYEPNLQTIMLANNIKATNNTLPFKNVYSLYDVKRYLIEKSIYNSDYLYNYLGNINPIYGDIKFN